MNAKFVIGLMIFMLLGNSLVYGKITINQSKDSNILKKTYSISYSHNYGIGDQKWDIVNSLHFNPQKEFKDVKSKNRLNSQLFLGDIGFEYKQRIRSTFSTGFLYTYGPIKTLEITQEYPEYNISSLSVPVILNLEYLILKKRVVPIFGLKYGFYLGLDDIKNGSAYSSYIGVRTRIYSKYSLCLNFGFTSQVVRFNVETAQNRVYYKSDNRLNFFSSSLSLIMH